MVCQRIESFRLKDDLKVQAKFFSGIVKEFDVRTLFDEYPEYRILEADRSLWASAELFPQGSGIYFNDDLDLSAEEIWENGIIADKTKALARYQIAQQISAARESLNMTQKQLSLKTGISQCDISRIEGGVSNPTIDTLAKILLALGLEIHIEAKS